MGTYLVPHILRTCADFLPRVRSKVCHICLQPEHAHPSEGDRVYWAHWLVFHSLLDLGDREYEEEDQTQRTQSRNRRLPRWSKGTLRLGVRVHKGRGLQTARR